MPFRPNVVRAIFERNFLGYFSNPAGYVFITLFVLVCSWAAFWQPVFFANNLADLGPLNDWMPYILLVFVPAITMSIWAEERKQGTDELLLTLPARDVEVVLGKYLAAVGIYTVSLAFLAVGHVPLLMSLGRPDLGVLAATYLGYWLMGAMLIAVGMVASILSSNITVAFILGALFCAVPVFAGGLGPVGQMLATIGGPFAGLAGVGGGRVAEAVSVPGQFRDFGAGVIPLAGVLYFVAMAAAMLFLNMVLLGRRHWAGGEASEGRWLHATVRVVAVVIGLVSLEVLVDRWLNVRVDATEERLHTLSPVSQRILREIPADRPVYIQAYLSPEVPREFVETRTDLVNTLKEFAAMGGDRVHLNLVEPKRYSPEAREAEKRFGITARRVQKTVDGKQSLDEGIYLGVAFTAGTEQVVVPFFDRGLPVEYELTRSIRVVSGSDRKRVGIIETDAKLLGGLDFRAMSQEPEWEIVSELKKQYDVSSVSADAPIPFEEVQTVSTSGSPTGGTFTLSFEGKTTAAIPFDADAKKVAEALEALESIGKGNVTGEGGPLPKEPVRVTFTGKFTGKDVAALEAKGDLTGGEKPKAQVGTTTEVLDAIVVAQAPSLTQPQIDNLTAFIRKGGPALLLIDPAPYVNLSLAPSAPRPPAGGMMGGQMLEPKGNLEPMLALLGLEWPSTQIVWEPYNPHKQLELPLEFVFIGEGSGASRPFGKDPITSGLQEVFLPFPGFVRDRSMPGDPEFTALLQTSDRGGVVSFEEAIESGPFGMSRPRMGIPHLPSDRAYTIAAHIHGKPREEESEGKPGEADDKEKIAPAREIHVVAIADLDVISDSIFDLRKRPVEALDEFNFDNVTFVLNCVDVLAGDDTFLDLRKKRPRHRTLTALEAAAKRFIEQAQSEQEKAENTAKEQLEKAKASLQEAVDKIRNNKEYDERTKESMVRYREQVEQRRLDLVSAEIEDQKRQAIEVSKARQDQAISAIQNRVRASALALTPLPALVLGGIVFFLRSRRENRGANPDRLA
jgi:ABC-type transport system involved in multi-copper enzyme maturation permease subunit/ABC-type uncharacterized transport system involved in gliding motility auxiliary subunit